jgi:hypothetical protein
MLPTSTETTPQPRSVEDQGRTLIHLRSLPSAQPGYEASGQAELQHGSRNRGGHWRVGMKLREVWEAARRDGLEMSVRAIPRLRFAGSRRRAVNGLQKRQRRYRRRPSLTSSARRWPGIPVALPIRSRNLREQREKKKQSVFEYDPFSINKNLID